MSEITESVARVVEIGMRVVALALLAWVAFDGVVIIMAPAIDWLLYARFLTMLVSSAGLGLLANLLRGSP